MLPNASCASTFEENLRYYWRDVFAVVVVKITNKLIEFLNNADPLNE